jgi:hypothetical protein
MSESEGVTLKPEKIVGVLIQLCASLCTEDSRKEWNVTLWAVYTNVHILGNRILLTEL